MVADVKCHQKGFTVLVINGPYRGSELKISEPQPFHRDCDLRRVIIYSCYLHDWIPLYLSKAEIKNFTGKEVN